MLIRIPPRSVLAAVLAVCFGLTTALTGCGVANDSGAPAKRPKIGFLVQKVTLSFGRELGDGYRLGAQVAGGVDVVVTSPPVSNVERGSGRSSCSSSWPPQRGTGSPRRRPRRR